MPHVKTLALTFAAGLFAQDPPKDLAGHWKFDDDKASTSAADSSGRGQAGKLVAGPAWTDGKVGGALQFDGKAYVEIPNSPDLENVQESNYTLAGWFKPENTPPGTEADNNAGYAILIKTGWHEGLRYTNEQKFTFDHWLQGDEPQWAGAGTWEETYEPGKWYHVVGVLDRASGATKIYVNGELVNSNTEWTANSATREYGKTTWKIGIASPGAEQWAWPARGAIDDVRIYTRALSDEEVKALYKAGSEGK